MPIKAVVVASILCVALLLAGFAGEQPGTIVLLERAIKAAGGEADLVKFQGYRYKLKGVAHGPNGKSPFTSEWFVQCPDRMRVDMEDEDKGKKLQSVTIVNGDKGWLKIGNAAAEAMDEKELDRARQDVYSNWIATLVPLKMPEFRLALVPEVKVEGVPAEGLRASRQGRRDVTLYFSKADGMLVKLDMLIRDADSGKEVPFENILGNYKEVQGMKLPTTGVDRQDGKLVTELQFYDWQLSEKLDDKLFAKP